MCTNLTSSPSTSSISLFSLSPGPMCLSAKSSCRGSILSICLDEERAADVRKPRVVVTAAAAAGVRDAPLFRILHCWSFQATRLLSLRCLHGAPGLTDLARKIPQDLAQLCISKSLSGDKSAETGETFFPTHWDGCDPCRWLCQLRQNWRVYTTARLHKSEPIRAETVRDAVTSPGQTAA